MSVALIRSGTGYTVPDGRTYGVVEVPLGEALHADIRPFGAAERLLREAIVGQVDAFIGPDDPTTVVPHRTRAGAVVIRDGHLLLIEFPKGNSWSHEIPGGGVEAGEDLPTALARELAEETGLVLTGHRRLATVYRSYDERTWLDHYFLAEAEGELGDPAALDLGEGEKPVWVPVADLHTLPAWPRRLCWRIAYWHENGWPAEPVTLSDCLLDEHVPGAW